MIVTRIYLFTGISVAVDRANNSLFIGKEHLTMDGREIKHVALIKTFGMLSPNKTTDEPMEFIGLDLETNHITGELMLLGFWEDGKYKHYIDHFLSILYTYVRKSIYDNKRIVWWNRLDPFIIFKQFLLIQKEPADIQRAMEYYGKIGGVWDKKEKGWIVKPVISVNINGHEFGILHSIRSSIQFYIKDGDEVKKTWAYDIAGMYQSGLEKEATSRFDWYSKVDKSAHLVNWLDFATDKHYREEIVLKSNMFDARAVHDLAIATITEFYNAFGAYPKNLISQGSLARSALMAQLDNLKLDANEHGKRIGMEYHMDHIVNMLGPKKAKDFFALVTEAYSAGYIEAIRFGHADKGAYADIASAYPAIIVKLYDLKDADYSDGTGTPERAKYGYTFIRGYINAPKHLKFNPITIKHPVHTSTNIRASGYYKASYTIEERDFMESLGCTFEKEHWVKIETKGELSPLAKVAQAFIDLRKELMAKGDSAQYMAKIASNSLYGILFECVNTFEEVTVQKREQEEIKDTFYKDILKKYRKKIDFKGLENEIKKYFDTDYHKIRNMWHGNTGMSPDVVKQELEYEGIYLKKDHPVDILYDLNELYRKDTSYKTTNEYTIEQVIKAGYRAGEFFNPIYATIITARTRVLLAKASQAIENNGGKVVALMTDSITWSGVPEMLPEQFWKEEKTLGYFEKPEAITDIISLGAGRYGFKNSKGYQTTKKRGIDAKDDLDWHQLLETAPSNTIQMKTRSLVSVGLVLGNHQYTYRDLGRVVEVNRDIDLVVGLTKRPLTEPLNLNKLKKQLVDTESFHIPKGMLGENDFTLSGLRNLMRNKPYTTRLEKRQSHSRETSKRYRNKNLDRIRQYDKERKRKKKLN